jgi:hypothetical protein
MKPRINHDVKYSFTYNPQFEKDKRSCLNKQDRHQLMLEEHKQEKATRRELHRKGIQKIKVTAHRLV